MMMICPAIISREDMRSSTRKAGKSISPIGWREKYYDATGSARSCEPSEASGNMDLAPVMHTLTGSVLCRPFKICCFLGLLPTLEHQTDRLSEKLNFSIL